MMMKTGKKVLTQAARLGCTVVVAMLSACTVDIVDNPVTPPADDQSAVDNGTWHVKAEYMDGQLIPGNNGTQKLEILDL